MQARLANAALPSLGPDGVVQHIMEPCPDVSDADARHVGTMHAGWTALTVRALRVVWHGRGSLVPGCYWCAACGLCALLEAYRACAPRLLYGQPKPLGFGGGSPGGQRLSGLTASQVVRLLGLWPVIASQGLWGAWPQQDGASEGLSTNSVTLLSGLWLVATS